MSIRNNLKNTVEDVHINKIICVKRNFVHATEQLKGRY